MTQLTNIAFIRAKKGRGPELGEQLLNLIAPSKAEPGCIDYIIHRSNDDPDMWCVYENWRTAGDLTAHFALPHMVNFINKVPSLVEGDLDLYSFSRIQPTVNN